MLWIRLSLIAVPIVVTRRVAEALKELGPLEKPLASSVPLVQHHAVTRRVWTRSDLSYYHLIIVRPIPTYLTMASTSSGSVHESPASTAASTASESSPANTSHAVEKPPDDTSKLRMFLGILRKYVLLQRIALAPAPCSTPLSIAGRSRVSLLFDVYERASADVIFPSL